MRIFRTAYEDDGLREVDLGQAMSWSFIRPSEAHALGWAMGGPWTRVNP